MRGINGNAIIKAVEIIKKMEDSGNLKKYKISLLDYETFYFCVVDLYNNGHAETINENAKLLLEKCGFTATICGIGWKINGLK